MNGRVAMTKGRQWWTCYGVFCGVVVDGAIPARRRVQESDGRHAAALIGWCWQSGIGGVARKGAAAETAATTSVPQRCRGGGGAHRRSSGGRFFLG